MDLLLTFRRIVELIRYFPQFQDQEQFQDQFQEQSVNDVNKRVLLYFKSYNSTSTFKTGERGSNIILLKQNKYTFFY